jgi:hypothetical protein
MESKSAKERHKASRRRRRKYGGVDSNDLERRSIIYTCGKDDDNNASADLSKVTFPGR